MRSLRKRIIFIPVITGVFLLLCYFLSDAGIFDDTFSFLKTSTSKIITKDQILKRIVSIPYNDPKIDEILQKLQLDDLNNVTYQSQNSTSLKDLVIVTAFSLNHLQEAEKSCRSISSHKQLKNITIIAYLLENLNDSIIDFNKYRKNCPFVELQPFPFQDYPVYVKQLNEYRWKNLIIAEVFRKYDLIIYADSSVIFKESNTTSFEKFIEDTSSLKYDIGTILLSTTGHTIKAATHPGMYKYLPIDDTISSKTQMFGATVMLWRKTPISMQILKTLVICSLLQDCIKPKGAILWCNHKNLWIGIYADCHRFDQSAVNILLANATNGDTSRYLNVSPLFSIERL